MLQQVKEFIETNPARRTNVTTAMLKAGRYELRRQKILQQGRSSITSSLTSGTDSVEINNNNNNNNNNKSETNNTEHMTNEEEYEVQRLLMSLSDIKFCLSSITNAIVNNTTKDNSNQQKGCTTSQIQKNLLSSYNITVSNRLALLVGASFIEPNTKQGDLVANASSNELYDTVVFPSWYEMNVRFLVLEQLDLKWSIASDVLLAHRIIKERKGKKKNKKNKKQLSICRKRTCTETYVMKHS